jgi:hypothetical protein
VNIRRVKYVYFIHHGKKGVKSNINYYCSEKTTMAIAAEIILREDVIGKV